MSMDAAHMSSSVLQNLVHTNAAASLMVLTTRPLVTLLSSQILLG